MICDSPKPGVPVLRLAESSPPHPIQTRSIEKRRRLLEAGRRQFATKGYGDTSIEDITSAAGTAVGAFYRHFASKRQFLVALMSQWLERLARLDPGEAAGTDARTALRRFLTRAFRADAAYVGVARAWQEACLGDDELARLEENIRQWSDGRVLAVFRLLQGHPRARKDRDLGAFAQMMNRHFWSLLARAPRIPRGAIEREVRVAADAIYHYLIGDPPPEHGVRSRRTAGLH